MVDLWQNHWYMVTLFFISSWVSLFLIWHMTLSFPYRPGSFCAWSGTWPSLFLIVLGQLVVDLAHDPLFSLSSWVSWWLIWHMTLSFPYRPGSVVVWSGTWTSLFHIVQGQFVLDLDPVGIKFDIFHQNALNRRYRDSKFLTPPFQRSGQTQPNLPGWHSWVFGWLSKAHMVRIQLLYDLHKCHKLQSVWPTWKSDPCLEMCWNWTSFCILLE